MKHRTVALGVAVLLAVTAGVFAVRWWHDRPPYGADAIDASVFVDMLGVGTSPQEPDRTYDGVGYAPRPGTEFVGGHAQWKPPAGVAHDWSEGWFMLFVIDKQVNLMASMVQGRSDSGMAVEAGADGVQNKIARKYPWLKGAGDVPGDNGTWWSGATTVMTTPAAGSITFVASFPAEKGDSSWPPVKIFATAPVERDNLLIALVFIGPDRQVYWAQRLYG